MSDSAFIDLVDLVEGAPLRRSRNLFSMLLLSPLQTAGAARSAFASRARSTSQAVEPLADLLRGTLAYKAVEVLYFGFALALAFIDHGFAGCVACFVLQSFGIALGYFGGLCLLPRLQRHTGRAMQAFSLACAACIVGAGSTGGLGSTAVMSLGSVFAGAAIGVKQWHELTRTAGAARESYLLLAQSGGAVIRILGMALSGLMLAVFHEGAHAVLVVGGLACIGALLWAGAVERAVPMTEAPRPLAALREASYWRSAPFFLIESGSAALRELIGVTGALTVVASTSAYSMTQASSGLLSAGAVAWLAGRRRSGPSLNRLRNGISAMMLAWALLALALVWAPAFIGFVVIAALANPLVSATYDSLVMRSIETPAAGAASHSIQSHAVAREMLLLCARCAALIGAWCLTSFVTSQTHMILIVLLLTIALLPIEFGFARRLMPRR